MSRAWNLGRTGRDPLDFHRRAMRSLAEANIVPGETGSSALAGLLALMAEKDGVHASRLLGIGEDATVLLFNSEGSTDPYARILVG